MVHTFLQQQQQLLKCENREQSHRNFNLSTLTYQVKEWDHNHKTGGATEDEKALSKLALKKNFLWLLSRNSGMDRFQHPSNDEEITKDIVGYLPTINAPATEMKTVNAKFFPSRMKL